MSAGQADGTPPSIGDHALIGDTHTAALVTSAGTIDWLCLPRFDSGACFAALLGDEQNGHWTVSPGDDVVSSSRRYRRGTLILETDFETADGAVRVVDFMPHRHHTPTVVRTVVGLRGSVPMSSVLRVRFDYGRTVPWVRRTESGIRALAGPDALTLTTGVPLRGVNMHTVGETVVAEGERCSFVLEWHRPGEPPSERVDPDALEAQTEEFWRDWSDRLDVSGPWADLVTRSLITLKALTYEPSGAVVAAPTTSLPEELGGERNWDYRYSWLRDASFTLDALTANGCLSEAVAWRDWLLRAVAGDPSQLQIMYGVEGERRLPEHELPWLDGHRASRPVRVGNAAADQLQLDVYGEVLAAMHSARVAGMAPDGDAWALQLALVDHVEKIWREPDEGIWEVRGDRKHFTHSKVMAWVAFDRAARGILEHDLDGDADRYRALAEEVHEEVCRLGYDGSTGTFVQAYGDQGLDASLLLMPAVGFLPADDERIVRTAEAIEKRLCQDGLVLRYRTDEGADDGLAGGEGAFVLCTFWMVDSLALRGEQERAEALFTRVVALANDVGLLSEEFDAATGEMLGNMPQAFSHVGLVNSAVRLAEGSARVEGFQEQSTGG